MRLAEFANPLREGLATQAFLENVADVVLEAFAERAPARIKDWIKFTQKYKIAVGSEEYNNPDVMGQIIFGELRDKFSSGLAHEASLFLEKQKGLRFFFKFTNGRYAAAYITITGRRPGDPKPSIQMNMPDEDIGEIIAIGRTGKAVVEKIASVLLRLRSNLVHELTHAFDDIASSGKYAENRRTKAAILARKSRSDDALAQYMNEPLEINARLSASLDRNKASVASLSATDFFANVRREFRGWNDVPSAEQRKLSTRIGAYYSSHRTDSQAPI